MSNPEEMLADVQALWDKCRLIFGRNGGDLASWLNEWAERKRQSLDKLTAQNSFDKPCRDGCQPLPLAFLMVIIHPLRSIEKKWKKITGTPREREQKIRAIEKAADVLEDLLGSFVNVLAEDYGESIDTDSVKELRQRVISPPEDVSAAKTKMPEPGITIQALRSYAAILQIFEFSQETTSVASSDMLAKYLISAYVYRATSRPHDEEVSALIGDGLSFIYDETAHRMWRKRNYERIDKTTLSRIADMLTAVGVVSASAT